MPSATAFKFLFRVRIVQFTIVPPIAGKILLQPTSEFLTKRLIFCIEFEIHLCALSLLCLHLLCVLASLSIIESIRFALHPSTVNGEGRSPQQSGSRACPHKSTGSCTYSWQMKSRCVNNAGCEANSSNEEGIFPNDYLLYLDFPYKPNLDLENT